MASNSYSKFEARRVENEAIKDICSGVRTCWTKLRGSSSSHRKSDSQGNWRDDHGLGSEYGGLMDDGASTLTRETSASTASYGSAGSTERR